MESINVVVLSGVISEDAKSVGDGPQDICVFTVQTYSSSGKGKDKRLWPESHKIALINPGTILKHLKRGKPVMINGRISPATGIIASNVHFPESRLRDE